jgi:hypothetical protein
LYKAAKHSLLVGEDVALMIANKEKFYDEYDKENWIEL